MKLFGLSLAAAVAVTLFGGAANAATATCPDDPSVWDRYASLTSSTGSVACEDHGTGNIDHFYPDPLSKLEDGVIPAIFSSVVGLPGADEDSGALSGSFTLDLTGLKNIFIGFKWGAANGACRGDIPGVTDTNNCEPDWALFEIGAVNEVVDFSWFFGTATGGKVNGLSHINVYGDRCTANDPDCGDTPVVPLPASLPLLAGALGLGGFALRRHKRSA